MSCHSYKLNPVGLHSLGGRRQKENEQNGHFQIFLCHKGANNHGTHYNSRWLETTYVHLTNKMANGPEI